MRENEKSDWRTRQPPMIGVVDRATATSFGVAQALQATSRFRADVRDDEFVVKLASGVISTENWHAMVFDPRQLGRDWANLLRVLRRGDPDLVLVAYSLDLGSEWCRSLAKSGVRAMVDKEEPLDVLALALQAALAGSQFKSARLREQNEEVVLSPREQEVVSAIASGTALKKIAEGMGVSRQTVYAYKQRAMSKLSVKTDIELYRAASERGYTTQKGADPFTAGGWF